MSIINNMMVIVPLIVDQRKSIAAQAGEVAGPLGFTGIRPPLCARPHPPERAAPKITAFATVAVLMKHPARPTR